MSAIVDSSLPSHVELLFNGSKTYWRENVTVDVLIVAHLNEPTIEVLVYSPVLGIESAHLYIDRTVVDSKLDQTVYLQKLSNSYAEKLHEKHFNVEHQVLNQQRVEYLLTRLKVAVDTTQRTVVATLAPCVGDALEEEILGRLEASIDKPTTLLPVRLEQWVDKSSSGTSSDEEAETSSKRMRKRLGIPSIFKHKSSRTGGVQQNSTDGKETNSSKSSISPVVNLGTVFGLRPLVIESTKPQADGAANTAGGSNPMSPRKWKLLSPRMLRLSSRQNTDAAVDVGHVQQQSGSDKLCCSTGSLSNSSTPRNSYAGRRVLGR